MRDTANDRPYVFISYASADRDRILPMVDRLEAAGIRTWIDRNGIHGGANYAQVITEAIKGSAVLLVFSSAASLASRNVRQELALGWRFDKPYLPLLLEQVTVPDEVAYWLEAAQWVDVLDHPESVWLGATRTALAQWGVESRVGDPVVRKPRPFLVGREREQGILREHLERMLDGHGGTILVGGEAGIGKTTLVEDLSVEAEERGALVLWGHAYDLSVTPTYGPWLEIFRQYRRTAGDLPPLPAFIFDVEELAKVGSQEILFAAVADFIPLVATQRPLVLVLDDLHWFDRASLDFFRFLARQVSEQPILMVATYRSDELHRRHQLFTLLPLLVREAGAERIEVRALDEVGHRALIHNRFVLDDADATRLEQYLVEHAEGNPLYASELLRTLEEEGVLVRDQDVWHVGSLDQIRVPTLLMQVIEARVARFDDESQRLLGVASVVGQTVPLNIWATVGKADESQLLDVAERAEEAQLIAEATDGNGVQFRHALIREALYERIPSLRRRRIHGVVGEILESLTSPDPETVAYHFQQAGDKRAVDWLIKAALRAEGAFVLRTAAERYDAAQSLLESDASQAELRGWLLYRLAFAKRFWAPEESLAYLDEVQELANQVGNQALKIVAQADRGFLHHMSGNLDASLQDLVPALDAYDSVPPDVWAEDSAGFAAVYPRWSGSAHSTSDLYLNHSMEVRRQSIVVSLASLGHFRDALDLADQCWSDWEAIPAWKTANALGGCGIAYAALGVPEQAWSAWQESVVLSLDNYNYVVAGTNVFRLLHWVHLPFRSDNSLERTNLREEVERHYQMAANYGNTVLPSAHWFNFALSFLEGDWQNAERGATTLAPTTIHPLVPALARCVLGLLAYHRGDMTSAWKQAGWMLPNGPATDPGKTLFLEGQIFQRLAAALALDAHDVSTARAWLEAHDRWLEWSGALLGRAEGTLLWAQYHLANGDREQASELADQALAHATDPRQPLVLIAIHRFLGQVDTEERRFVQAEQQLQESLRLAEACAAPFERALTLLEIARLRAARGESAQARELLAEVRGICEPLEARPTLEKVAILEHRLRAAS